MIFNFANFSIIQKVEIKCPESRKILTTQYKFDLIEVDAKHPGGGEGRVGSMRSLADKGEEGSTIGKSYGRLIWMAPYSKISITY